MLSAMIPSKEEFRTGFGDTDENGQGLMIDPHTSAGAQISKEVLQEWDELWSRADLATQLTAETKRRQDKSSEDGSLAS